MIFQPIYTLLVMDIVDRLIAFRDYTGFSNSQFADKAGIPRPTLSQFLNGRNKRLSDDLTSKLHSAYPNLNVLWLLFGEGDMLVDPNIQFSETSETLESENSAAQIPDSQPSGSLENAPSLPLDDEVIQESESENHSQQVPPPSNTHNSSTEGVFPMFNTTQMVSTVQNDPQKKIQSIMVFYNDNSFEIFTPNCPKAAST